MDGIEVRNHSDETINIVAFQILKLVGNFYAWKVLQVEPGQTSVIDATLQFYTYAEAENMKSDTLPLNVDGEKYELTPDFQLKSLGRANQRYQFSFHVAEEAIQNYKNIHVYMIRGNSSVFSFKAFLPSNSIVVNPGIVMGCANSDIEEGKLYQLRKLISNQAHVKPGESVSVDRDAQGKLQINLVEPGS
ncbi:MAG: hypothetical protein ETSY1_42620 [Candidatus Entotheonella factor]|uniref:Uncharacterized protein n=1 Tax=Entotheonella factor TaxID=1429438 RepID=W4L3K4_ENTF1|nr:MAG: hypothetical protein ETSY1_42620 [Candidatus Entotheonella factor]